MGHRLCHCCANHRLRCVPDHRVQPDKVRSQIFSLRGPLFFFFFFFLFLADHVTSRLGTSSDKNVFLIYSSDIWKPPPLTEGHCVAPQQENAMMAGHQSIGLIIDVALLALPIWIIYDKMLFSKRAMQVILIFSIGIFVVVAGIIRLYMIKTLLFLADP